jgi:hypothetical protein
MATEDSLDIFGADPLGRDIMYGLSTGRDNQGLAPYGFRYAESVNQPITAKGRGYLGNVGTMQEPMTELSASSDFGGRTVRYPLIVPTLTADELNLLRSGGEPTQEIYSKAQQYALGRLARGEDPFATPQDLRYPQPQAVDTRPYDQMQATPRGFISGLFSDVLGRTLNMPSMPRTGIPSLDLLYANRNPLFNVMGVGDVQKTAERISYGEPLTTGSGMTLKPREETVFAGMAVAPLVGEAANLGIRAGRAGARMIGQGIAENVAMGRSSLPSMFAEPRSSLFAVEPNAMMPKPQAPVSELGFYSAAEQAAMNLQRNKGTGQAFLNDLMKAPDVKKDELSWIGLDDFLKDKPNVTKQEVQDFIANNKIDLQEVRLGETPVEDPVGIAKRKAIFDKYETEIQQLYSELDNITAKKRNALKLATAKYDEMLYQLNKDGYMPTAQDYEAFNLAEEELRQANRMQNDDIDIRNRLGKIQNMRDAEADAAYVVPETMPTKYSRYQLAGGENYREILLKLPSSKTSMEEFLNVVGKKYGGNTPRNQWSPEDNAMYEKLLQEERTPIKPEYRSSHFNEPNILAHMRVNDRIDADGKKMLLVEEIQSDWHQAGREKGYAGQFKDLPNDYKVQSKTDKDGYTYYEVLDPQGNVFAKDYSKGSVTNQAINRLNETVGGVPDAPFKDTWYQLALKRILKYAADNGYERVGLTTGTQQAKRYDLGNEVNSIDVESVAGVPNLQLVDIDVIGGQKIALEVENGVVREGEFAGKRLSDVVGKEMADKITNVAQGQTKSLVGKDLRIGGEGMKKYYDEVYPKFLEKYGKKWDAKVGETKIGTEASPKSWAYFRDWFAKNHSDVGGSSTALSNWEKGEDSKYVREFLKQNKVQEPIRYIDITPKMKESIKKGQPLASAEQAPEMLASGGLDYADPFRNPLLESTIG